MPIYAIHDGNRVLNTIVAESKEIAEECTQLFAMESIDYKPWVGWEHYENGWRPSQPFPSWAWDESDKEWTPPIQIPSEFGDWAWDEEDLVWVEIIPEQTYPSWVWDDEIHEWVAPAPYPDDSEAYRWNEENKKWELVVQ